MSTQVQFKRGTTNQNNAFTGAEGEITVDLTKLAVRVHDGVTVGGFELARANMSNVPTLDGGLVIFS
jgi:hypothetical protein